MADAPIVVDSWQLVDRDGRVELRLASSHDPGRLVISSYATGMSAYDFRRSVGGDQPGEADTLPMLVRYEAAGMYQQLESPFRRFRFPGGLPIRTTFVAVEKDMRWGGAQAEWRWDSRWGVWERYSRSGGWRSVPPIYGPARDLAPAPAAAV